MAAAMPRICRKRPPRKNAAAPKATAPSRSQSGELVSVPVGKKIILAMTAATSAVATARTQFKSSERSSMRLPTRTPAQRQKSVASQPATAM